MDDFDVYETLQRSLLLDHVIDGNRFLTWIGAS
jgi:hypothetical protein